MAEATRLGRDTGIELRFVSECATSAGQELADALFSLAVEGQTVWGSRNQDGPDTHRVSLSWPLVDLLHGLGRIWPWLILEEGYPTAISPLHPGDMMGRAETRWNDLSPAEAEAEEELLFDFRHRHDLSLLLRGLTVPPLWILREGADALVWSQQWVRPTRLSHRAVMDDLTAIGEGIARHLSESTHPRALRALRRWSERTSETRAAYLPLVTGMEPSELRQLPCRWPRCWAGRCRVLPNSGPTPSPLNCCCLVPKPSRPVGPARTCWKPPHAWSVNSA